MDSGDVRVISFNTILNNLVDKMMSRFPRCHHISFFNDQVKFATKYTPLQPVVSFIQASLPFSEEIKKRNSNFFLQLATADEGFADLRLYEKWSELTDQERETIWRYVDQLFNLGRNIILHSPDN